MVPSRFSNTGTHDHPEDQNESHSGNVRIQSFNPFAIYGLFDRVNLIARIPFLQWHQTADEPDNHHRTETITGFGDMSLGARWLVLNQSFGPGHRFFLGFNMTLPTAKSYETNPFSENADSVKHRHFALGTGQLSSSVNFEWWFRSEFPFILGVSGNYNFPWRESDVGYRLGEKVFLNVHAIRQAPFFERVFPYVKFKVRYERPDFWERKKARNSGGTTIDGMLGVDLEISERISAVVLYRFPIWRELEGTQLDLFTLSLSVRRMGHWHRS